MHACPSELRVVLTTLPDLETARTLALALLEHALAACVQVGAPIFSFYPWEGRLEQTTEIPVTIKTTQALYPALEAFITKHHPYEVPQILALPVWEALPAYRDWVMTHCRPEP